MMLQQARFVGRLSTGLHISTVSKLRSPGLIESTRVCHQRRVPPVAVCGRACSTKAPRVPVIDEKATSESYINLFKRSEDETFSERDVPQGETKRPESYKEYISTRLPHEFISEADNLDDLDPDLEDCPPLTTNFITSRSAVNSDGDSLEKRLANVAGRHNADDAREPALPSELIHEKERLIRTRIRYAQCHGDVLDLYLAYRQELTMDHYEAIVIALTDLINKGRVVRGDLLSEPRFVDLCAQLCTNTRHCDAQQLLQQLLLLTRLRVPGDATILLTTLQILRHRFNELSLKQLLFLDKMLGFVRQCNLASALRQAIPLNIENRYRTQPLPPDLTTNNMIWGFHNSVRDKSMAMAQKFMMALYQNSSGLQGIGSSIAAAVLIPSLLKVSELWTDRCSDGRTEGKEELPQLGVMRKVLLKEALQATANNMANMRKQTSNSLMYILSSAYHKGDRAAHSQALLTSYVTKVMAEKWPVQDQASAVSFIYKMNEIDEILLDNFFTALEAASSEDLTDTRIHIMPVIDVLAASEAVAAKEAARRCALLEKLLKHPSYRQAMQKDDNIEYLGFMPRLGNNLVSMGYFDSTTMTEILNHSSNLLSTRSQSNVSSGDSSAVQYKLGLYKMSLLRFWQGLRLLAPVQLQLSEPSGLSECFKHLKEVAQQDADKYSRGGSLVQQLLHHVLRACHPHVLVSAVYTKNFMLLDNVLVVTSDGRLVPQTAAAKGGVSLAELDIPQNSKTLCIFEVNPRRLLSPGNKLGHGMKLKLKVLSAEGVTAVPLLMPQLLQHPTDEQRVQYVTSALHQHGLYV